MGFFTSLALTLNVERCANGIMLSLPMLILLPMPVNRAQRVTLSNYFANFKAFSIIGNLSRHLIGAILTMERF